MAIPDLAHLHMSGIWRACNDIYTIFISTVQVGLTSNSSHCLETNRGVLGMEWMDLNKLLTADCKL